jgi:hypothetical protein
LTLDQKIQVWGVVGSWLSGMATLAAVCLTLWLVNRSDRVRVNGYAGIRLVVEGDGTPAEKQVCISVTNLGERAVTVNTVGWRIGEWRRRRYAIQNLAGRYSAQYPTELGHGKSASFMVSLKDVPNWPTEFMSFVGTNDRKNLSTLRAAIHTSVGQSIYLRPEEELIELLAKATPKQGPSAPSAA